jgi:hypothetical protein
VRSSVGKLCSIIPAGIDFRQTYNKAQKHKTLFLFFFFFYARSTQKQIKIANKTNKTKKIPKLVEK